MIEHFYALISISICIYATSRLISFPMDRVVKSVEKELFPLSVRSSGLTANQTNEIEKEVFHRTKSKLFYVLDYLYILLFLPSVIVLCIYGAAADEGDGFEAPNWVMQVITIIFYWLFYGFIRISS